MRIAILFVCFAGLSLAQPLSDFAGTWVMKVDGQAIFKLTLAVDRGRVTGALTKPKGMTIDQDDNITGIEPEQVTQPIEKSASESGKLVLTIDGDPLVMALQGADRATLAIEGMPRPFKLERVPAGLTVVLATTLKEPDYAPEIRALRERLKAMVKEDQDARMAFDAARMESADSKNRVEVLNVFEKYGWPPSSLIGKDATHDYWLLVQHQTPEIQQRLLPAMEKAAKAGQASMTDYAYLYDRVQMGLGKPQRWGSQVKCENGKPALYVVDDPAGLEQRRKELFMMPVAEYLKVDYLVKNCAASGK